MRVKILECALGEVCIITNYAGEPGHWVVVHNEGYRWGMFLPGGKFTAREFLELYLRNWHGEY